MSKTYHALLVGAPPQEEMRLEAPIDGQPSCSTLTLLESTPTSTKQLRSTNQTKELEIQVWTWINSIFYLIT